MNFSLIVPVAADDIKYDQQMPYVFGLNNNGIMHCINSIMGLNLDVFSNIYFTILEKHDKLYHISELLHIQFLMLGLKNAKVLSLSVPTDSQAETVYQTIKEEGITGGIFIKDADGYFSCTVHKENGVAVFPLEQMPFVNPQNKSYVSVDDLYYITNIIEKRVISHFINAGGSCFENAEDYCRYYDKIISFEGKIYISHIIYAMLLDKQIFRPIEVSDFRDFGNDTLFKYYISAL